MTREGIKFFIFLVLTAFLWTQAYCGDINTWLAILLVFVVGHFLLES